LTPFTCISRDVDEKGSLSMTIIALLNGIYNNIRIATATNKADVATTL
jgi:hypothetical protein